MDQHKITPVLKQYLEIKKHYPDTILFFRMGDFYEMFFDDAKTAAPILDVVLTSRNKSKEGAVPLCGVPYHAKENYAAKLLRNGFRVAICEQVEDPALAKGIVRREVTQVLTPATALEIDGLDTGLNKYLACLFQDKENIALACLDIASAEFAVKAFPIANKEELINELFRKAPKEILMPKTQEAELGRIIARCPDLDQAMIETLAENEFSYFECESLLRQHFQLQTVEGLGMANYPAAVIVSGVLLKYLHQLRKTGFKNIATLRFSAQEDYLVLDAVSFRNLEILINNRSGTSKGTLLEAVDFTITPMGKRLLKNWLSYPLLNVAEINRRSSAVAEFLANLVLRSEVRKALKPCGDLARLNAKITLNIATPHHLLQMKAILRQIPIVQQLLQGLQAPVIKEICSNLDPLMTAAELIDRSIRLEPAILIGEGNVIKPGYSRELDELLDLRRHATEIIAAMESSERNTTGIPSLKIRYNKVFGYFIEVTKPHLKLVPPHYIRKQTLVNAERFLNAELKELEEKILKAEEKIAQLEKSLYDEILKQIQQFAMPLNSNADLLGLLDVCAAGGELAQRRGYCQPVVQPEKTIQIQEGRHAVLELDSAQKFIPNDLNVSADQEQILIITGPNMGGKSTFLRQNALIIILAQAGYFVPAKKAEIGICDRIFTRIGAADSLTEGKSTFLVEMIEAAIILHNATAKSLILLDEIGRGTSTFDGLSIAWAMVEHLHQMKQRPRTLFATHYHELTELSSVLERVKNYHSTVKEWQDSVIFLHKIASGSSDQSFGIHVAKIAGVPHSIIERAKDILLNLEKKELNRLVKERITGKISRMPEKQAELFPEELEWKVWDEIREKLQAIAIEQLTPLQAMAILQDLKNKSEKFQ